jgi:signal transduction histidine kinase
VVVLPVESGQTRFGELAVAYAEDEEYEDDLPVLQAVADLAASAVENARLYRAAEQSAALLERQRLARELHDSVSQALFSMTLHARTAQRLLHRADPAGADQLDAQLAKLCELSTGALAEMRALIFELRPGAVVEEGFAAALSRQVHALTARENLDITITCPGERVPLDPNTEEHLYRICLEALHNVVKHAHASSAQVEVAVDQENERLAVAVRDDGAGFDPTIDRPGHLGQRTMRERAEAIGATLRVVSAPGAGTEVRLALPLRARS